MTRLRPGYAAAGPGVDLPQGRKAVSAKRKNCQGYDSPYLYAMRHALGAMRSHLAQPPAHRAYGPEGGPGLLG
jgi:hypothetical protein